MLGATRAMIAEARADLWKWRLTHLGPRPRLTVFHDRTVTPHRWDGPNNLRMGSYAPDGRMDPESALFRRYRPRILRRLGQPYPEPLEGRHAVERGIFAGPLLPAYGHFLLESLARLWAAGDYPDHPILWSVASTDDESVFQPWMGEVLTLLGVTNPIVLVNRPVVVTDLVIPAPGYEIQYRFGHHHSRFLSRIAWQPERGRKLWVSRSGVDRAEGLGRAELEAALHDNGWTILRPETVSIEDQLHALAQAERIAGEQGSALHSLILMHPAPGLRLDVFARDPALDRHSVNSNQDTICARRKITYRLHKMTGEAILERRGSRVVKRYCPPETYLERLAGA